MNKIRCKNSFPSGYWNNVSNIQLFLQEIKQKYKLQTAEDWNSITANKIKQNGGGDLLKTFSLRKLKAFGCPEGKFDQANKPANYWKNKENIKNLLQKLQIKMKLETKEDWNLITHKIIEKELKITSSISRKYSIYELKCLGFPEGKDFFKKRQVNKMKKPANYWKDTNNIENFLSNLKNKLNLNSDDDWNLITSSDIISNGGKSLLKLFSLHDLKLIGCKKENIEQMLKQNKKITKTKKQINYWKNDDNVKKFINNLRETYNLKTINDWNSLTCKQIKLLDGASILQYHSIYDIKFLGCPEGKLFFKKSRFPRGYWDNEENIQKFIVEIKEKLNLDDWNLLTVKDIQNFGGNSLLQKYSINDIKLKALNDSNQTLKEINSDNKYEYGYWRSKENVLNFLDHLKQQLNLNSPKDWSLLTTNTIKQFGGGSLLHFFSIFELKCLACPEGISIFKKPKNSPGYWNHNENIENFLGLLQEKLNLHTMEDWNRISKNQILFHGGRGLLSKLSKQEIIQSKYPNYNNSSINSSTKSSQRWLFLQIQKLFPEEEIIEDYFHSEISRKTGYSVQFDVFLVNRDIAFEYHGQQHYEDIPAGFSPNEVYKFRDKEKEKICKEFSIPLIIIPYWWDNTLDSLKSTIKSKLDTLKT